MIAEMRVFPAPTTEVEKQVGAGRWTSEFLGCRATVPPGGLPARVAREGANLGRAVIEAQKIVLWARREAVLARKHGLHRNEPFSSSGMWGALGVKEPERLTVSPGRERAVMVRYSKAADAYVSALKNPDHQRSPTKYAAGRCRLSAAKARDYIYQARQRGLLSPKTVTRGRSAGELTPLALELLGRGSKR